MAAKKKNDEGQSAVLNKNAATECRAIKAIIARGEACFAECEKHYKAAGARLAILKTNKAKDVTWPEICDACDISKTRADQLIRLAQGRATLEGERATNAESMRTTRAAERTTRVVHLAKVPTDDPPMPGLALKVALANTEQLIPQFVLEEISTAEATPLADAAERVAQALLTVATELRKLAKNEQKIGIAIPISPLRLVS